MEAWKIWHTKQNRRTQPMNEGTENTFKDAFAGLAADFRTKA